MKKLFDSSQQTEEIKNIPSADTSDIDDILSSYKTEALLEPEKVSETSSTSPVQPLVQTGDPSLNQPVQWQGNPLYYQSGKKQGQLKPTDNKIKTQIVPDQSMSTISGDIISGALLMTLIDLILPMIFVFGNNYFSKTKIKVSDLEMTEKQKNQLAPVADKVAHQLRISANPTVLLIFTMFGIYGINLMKARLLSGVKERNTKPESNEKN